MNKKTVLFSCTVILTLGILLSFSTDSAWAHPHMGHTLINDHTHHNPQSQTETIPINDIMGLEKSTVLFHSPENNSLPWGFVEGKIANHVEGYPVIIQIFKDTGAVHFAQADVTADGKYEYRFRVLNSENGTTSKIFDGDYTVNIFKVVYLTHDAGLV